MPVRSRSQQATRRAVALVLATALSALGCAGDRSRRDRPKNLLIVTLDTVRADRVGAYGYSSAETPHLDRLAERGARFEQASTVMPLTLPAHSSLFTGTFPTFHGVRDNGGFYLGEEQVTLAEVLRDHGLRTGGFVAAFVLDSRWGIAQGFDHFFDDFDLSKYDDAPGMDAIQRPGSQVVDRTLQWLAEDREQPFFAWVHLYDAHTPYQAPEPFRSRFPETLEGAYDAEISFADAQLGRLVASLEANDQLDETLIVVLADHGEMLGEHQEMTHGFFVYESAIRVPLIVAGPGVATAVVPDLVRVIDVLPTVLGRFGIVAPPAVQGADLEPLWRGKPLRLVAQAESWFPRYHYGWSELLSIRDGAYKLIRAPRPELYDLERDPHETNNLAGIEPAIAARLDETLTRMLGTLAATSAQAPQAIDDEDAERLRALGYLGHRPSSRYLEPQAAPRGDPKDKIGLYNLLKEAMAAKGRGEVETAIATAERALAQDPEIVEGHLLLGNFYRDQGLLESAIGAYRRALGLDPEHHEALYSLAITYKDAGRLDDSLAGLERAHDLDPRNGKVLWQLADAEIRRANYSVAEERLLHALELDLDPARFLYKLGECYYAMKRFEPARERLEQALDANPELRGAAFTLGLVHEDAGNIEAAITAYRRELALSPDAFRASFNLAKLLARAGLSEEALRHFQRAIEIQPQFGTGHLYLAKALLDSGDLPGAEEAARLGLERNPERSIEPLGHYVLADIFHRRGRPDLAEREVAVARRLERETAGR